MILMPHNLKVIAKKMCLTNVMNWYISHLSNLPVVIFGVYKISVLMSSGQIFTVSHVMMPLLKEGGAIAFHVCMTECHHRGHLVQEIDVCE